MFNELFNFFQVKVQEKLKCAENKIQTALCDFSQLADCFPLKYLIIPFMAAKLMETK
jgi:hypothetical protein